MCSRTEVNFNPRMNQMESISPVLKKLNARIKDQIKFAVVFCFYGSQDRNEDVILVTKDDYVFGIGLNENGCLGLGHEKRVEKITRNGHLSKKKVKIIDRKYGLNFGLCADGQIYVWGKHWNDQARNRAEGWTPKQVTLPLNKKFVDIQHGFYTTICLTDDGEVYDWKTDKYDELEDGFKKIDFPDQDGVKVKLIYSTTYISFAQLEDGRVYGWTDNEYGQDSFKYFKEGVDPLNGPHLIMDCKSIRIKKISCGYDHVLMLDEDRKLYAWGRNDFGQLGDGTKEERKIMREINVPNIVAKISDIHAESFSSSFLTKDGQLYIFGSYISEKVLSPRITEYSFFEMPRFSITYKWTFKGSGKKMRGRRDPKPLKTKEEKENQNKFILGLRGKAKDEQKDEKEPSKDAGKKMKKTMEMQTKEGEKDDKDGSSNTDSKNAQKKRTRRRRRPLKMKANDQEKGQNKTLELPGKTKEGEKDDKDDSSNIFDVKLIADAKSIKTNKRFLSLASRKFEKMFQEKQESNEFIMKDLKYEILQSMINHVYGRPIDPNLADQLLIVAHEYEMDGLKKAAGTELINLNNAF